MVIVEGAPSDPTNELLPSNAFWGPYLSMELGVFLVELLQHIDEICQAYCCRWNSSTTNNSQLVKCYARYLSQTVPSLPWHTNPYRKQEILKYASNNDSQAKTSIRSEMSAYVKSRGSWLMYKLPSTSELATGMNFNLRPAKNGDEADKSRN